MNTHDEKVYASHWATVSNGQIAQIATGYPPQELRDCQIALTPEEYDLLHKSRMGVEKIESLVESIKAKIKANGGS